MKSMEVRPNAEVLRSERFWGMVSTFSGNLHNTGETLTNLAMIPGPGQQPERRREAFTYIRDSFAILAILNEIWKPRLDEYCEKNPSFQNRLRNS